MNFKGLTTLWTQGRRSTDIFYVSENEMCFVCGNFVKILGMDGSERNFQGTVNGLSCLTASQQLGVIAVSDKKPKPTIHIAKYPNLNMLRIKLHDEVEQRYLRMAFVGTEYLVTVADKLEFVIAIWKWSAGCKLSTFSQQLNLKAPLSLRLSVSPEECSRICVQHSEEIVFLELHELGCNVHITSQVWYPPAIGDEECLTSVTEQRLNSLTVFDKMSNSTFGAHSGAIKDLPMTYVTDLPTSEMVELYDYLARQKRLQLKCHCWLPSGDVLIGCSKGRLLLMRYETFETVTFFDLAEWEKPFGEICAAAVNKEAVFVGKKNGFVYKFLKTEDTVELLKIIHTNVFIMDFLFSPDYKRLIIMSVNGSVFLHDPNNKSPSTYSLVERRDTSSVIGMCMTFASHCLIAKRNGLLEVWSVDYSVLTTKFQINACIECLESCPVCSIVLAGASSGYVYVIDATDVTELRMLKSFKAFDTSVIRIRYENFGRYAALLSQEEGVILMNGIPTSGLNLLGTWKLEGIVDVCLFTKNIDEESLLIVLGRSVSDEVTHGMTLTRIAIPKDFYKSYKDCWKNGIPVLNESLCGQCVKLAYPGVSLSVHCVLGVLIFVPNRRSIQILHIGANPLPSCLQPETEIMTQHESENIRLSLDLSHNWLASYGEDGKLFIYKMRNLKHIYCADSLHSFRSQGITAACFSEVKPLLILGGGDGSLVCTAWEPGEFHEEEYFTPWADYSRALKAEQNSHVISMESEDLQDVRSWTSLITASENKEIIKLLQTLKCGLDEKMTLIYDMLDDLVHQNNLLPKEYQLKIKNFILDGHVFKKMLKRRSETFLCVRYHLRVKLENLKKEAARLRLKHVDSMKTTKQLVKSFREEKNLYNYSICERSAEDIHKVDQVLSKKQLLYGKKQTPGSLEKADQKQENSSTENDLCDPFDLKTREQKIDQVIILKDLIHEKKTAFNKKFDELVKFKSEQKWLILEKIGRLKYLLLVLDFNEEVFEPDWGNEENLKNLSRMPDDDRTSRFLLRSKQKRTFQRRTFSDDETLIKSSMISKLNSLIAPRDENEKNVLGDVVKPDFMDEVPVEHWTKSETDIAKHFSGKLEAHQKRKLKYLNKLQEELLEVKASVNELIDEFDCSHQALLTRKLECDFFVHLKEFTIAVILFTVIVDEQLKTWEREINEVIKNKSRYLNSLETFTMHAEKAIAFSTWKKAKLLIEDQQLNISMRTMKCDRRCLPNLISASQKRPVLSGSKSGLDPYESEGIIYNRNEIQKSLKALDSNENKPKNVNLSDWKHMCYMRMQKFILEQKIHQQNKCTERYQRSLAIGKTRMNVMVDEINELKEGLRDIRDLRLLCINDMPQVMEVEYQNMETAKIEELASSCFVILRDIVDQWSQKAAEAKNMLLNTLRDGAEVRTELKIGFIEYKRLNIKMQECRRKLKLLQDIPMSKDLKAVLASGVVDPYAKAESIQQSAEHEKRELLRQISHAEIDEKRAEREIVREVLRYRSLEKRIEAARNDLSQLKRLCDDNSL